MERKIIPTVNGLSGELCKRLLELKTGDVIPYAEISTIIGRDAQRKGRSTMSAAVRRMQADHGITFRPIQNVGLKRCDDIEKIDVLGGQIGRARRAVKRGAIVAASVENFEELPKEQRDRHNGYLTIASMVAQVTDGRSNKRLEQAVQNAGKQLTLETAFDAFKGS